MVFSRCEKCGTDIVIKQGSTSYWCKGCGVIYTQYYLCDYSPGNMNLDYSEIESIINDIYFSLEKGNLSDMEKEARKRLLQRLKKKIT